MRINNWVLPLPPKILHLHLAFDGWLDDELIECFPCFLTTESLLKELKKSILTGFSSHDVEVTYSELFLDLYSNRQMPQFKWLIINGNDSDNFFINDKNYLVVSHKVMNLIKEYGQLDNCEIEEVFFIKILLWKHYDMYCL